MQDWPGTEQPSWSAVVRVEKQLFPPADQGTAEEPTWFADITAIRLPPFPDDPDDPDDPVDLGVGEQPTWAAIVTVLKLSLPPE